MRTITPVTIGNGRAVHAAGTLATVCRDLVAPGDPATGTRRIDAPVSCKRCRRILRLDEAEAAAATGVAAEAEEIEPGTRVTVRFEQSTRTGVVESAGVVRDDHDGAAFAMAGEDLVAVEIEDDHEEDLVEAAADRAGDLVESGASPADLRGVADERTTAARNLAGVDRDRALIYAAALHDAARAVEREQRLAEQRRAYRRPETVAEAIATGTAGETVSSHDGFARVTIGDAARGFALEFRPEAGAPYVVADYVAAEAVAVAWVLAADVEEAA